MVVLTTVQLRQLSTAFYARVARDPVLRPLFPGKTLHCAIEELTAFLVQFFDGPPEDTQRRWWVSLRESHLRFKIGQLQRDAWMHNMRQALLDVPLEEPARGELQALFERSSAYLVNVGHMPAPPEPEPSDTTRRWHTQLALDQTVAAIRNGQTGEAERFTHNRPVFAALLAIMIDSREPALHAWVKGKIAADPALAHTRYSGRTLLHKAAGAGNVSITEALLEAGADPNVRTDGGHTPLYCLANECKAAGGEDVVRVLIHAGARVNAADGVKHCTALHMAARRGNAAIAESLVHHGADIEARDSLGVTPLGRALNCRKPHVAALLTVALKLTSEVRTRK